MTEPPDLLLFDSARKKWIFQSEPNVRRMLRRVFGSVSAEKGHTITLSHTPAVARDVEWFLQRYPHKLDDTARMVLTSTAGAAKEREEQCRGILSGNLGNVTLTLAKPAREYQRIAIELADAVGGLLLGDDLGLGKTLVGIGLATMPQYRPMLVVCEKHLQKQWVKKLKEFAPQLVVRRAKSKTPERMDCDVLVMTYHKTVGWAGHIQPKCLIFDEVQNLRSGEKTDMYKACAVLAETADCRVGLSATPVYNYGGEIWNIMQILRPGALGDAHEFVKEWCSTTSGGKWIVDDPQALGGFLRRENLMLRRVRADVGRELPPVQSFAELVPYDEAIMNEMSESAMELAKTILHGANLEKGQAARQLDLMLRQATGVAKAPYVARLVADMARAGKKVILAGWHREVYTVWQRIFAQEEIRAWMYTGSESETQKDTATKDFIEHDGGGVFILSLRSGAGLDGLQTVCDTVVFGELDWSPQTHIQLIGRALRDGQMNPAGVSVFYLVSDAGSDPIIAALLGVKMEQGAGITDPDLEISDKPLADRLTSKLTSEAEKNPMVHLAREFIKRHNPPAALAA